MSGPVADGRGWPDALDQLEERLRRQEELVAGGGSDVPGDWAPDVSGPMPAELRSRAVALLERTRRLEEVATAKLAASAAPRQASYASYGTGATDGADHGSL